MDIKIVNYKKENKKDLKRMIIELRQFEIDIDAWRVFKMDKEYKEKAIEEILNNVKEKKGKIYLAKYDDKIIGYIAGYIIPNKENFETYTWERGYVDELYLSEKYRGMGIGKKLLGKIEEYFRKKKCDTIGIHSMIANKSAIALYEKNGYEERSLFLSKALNKKVKK